ncbi:hypothetical protein PYW07_015330 [Mythimna separata]|uniref:Uncharacterized protein n=1 Tax=Mythimna separata TaxID=271217 RepID=A0AAD7YYP9_MYTSE|nr:hypothetical protein PYW07_015330 [Mythimna separata]
MQSIWYQLHSSHRTKPIKMKSMILVALALVAVAVAAPVEDYTPVEIVRSKFDSQPDGAYSFGYETADGSVREETGEVVEALDEENKPHNVVVVKGFYSYVNADGTLETIKYKADSLGYSAEGPSIPKVESQ